MRLKDIEARGEEIRKTLKLRQQLEAQGAAGQIQTPQLAATAGTLTAEGEPVLSGDGFVVTPELDMESTQAVELTPKQQANLLYQKKLAEQKIELAAQQKAKEAEALKLNPPPITPPKEEKTTDVQKTTGLYANRLEQSGDILNSLESYAANANPFTFQAQQNAPQFANIMKSSDFRRLEQAQRNFLNATLRRESGAVISKEEIADGIKQYFPIPGDDAKTIEQKRENRKLVAEQFKTMAGAAYKPYKKTETPKENKDPLGLFQ